MVLCVEVVFVLAPVLGVFLCVLCFFFNDTATTEIYTLSLHDALPISARSRLRRGPPPTRSPRLSPRATPNAAGRCRRGGSAALSRVGSPRRCGASRAARRPWQRLPGRRLRRRVLGDENPGSRSRTRSARSARRAPP